MAKSHRSTTFRLDQARYPRAFQEEESLWGHEIFRIGDLLHKHCLALQTHQSTDHAQESTSSSRDDHGQSLSGRRRPQAGVYQKEPPVLSVAVFGTYGAGKTSFLKTLQYRINHHQFKDSQEDLKHWTWALPEIEPKLLSRQSNFLYAFLANVLEEDARQTKRDGDRSAREPHILSPVQQAFQEVSEYLQAIDDIDRPQEYDPLGLSLERLDRHSSGLQLKRKVHNLIDELIRRLFGHQPGALLILPVDDADMSLEDLVSTLEIYRRYLVHPQLVPVFTFTSRLAEELLRVHFARKLTVNESQEISEKLSEVSTSLEMTEHLAQQYLVKLFPIRNRIRLGPAPARVQGARYIAWEEDRDTGGNKYGKAVDPQGKKVYDLLETSSRLLFGCAEWPTSQPIKLALRPSTLRRQLQILDAMTDARVTDLISSDDSQQVKPRAERTSWARIFDAAVWSLLNAHRDVLREYQMYIEDIYSWSQQSLRQVFLDTLLMHKLEERRRLLKRWSFRTEDRRSQILSLFAANVFRPPMPEMGEEPSSDYPVLIQSYDSEDLAANEKGRDQFSVEKGIIWFLNLWIGFYLPQVLAQDRPDNITKKDPRIGRVRGIGWGLRNGPIHATREALMNVGTFTSGMLFLDPEDFSKCIKKLHENRKGQDSQYANLLLHIWCLYGYHHGKPWVAVSFWRGLGLIGLLLEDYEYQKAEARAEKKKKMSSESTETSDNDNSGGDAPGVDPDEPLRRHIHALIRKHCNASRVPDPIGIEEDPISFPMWDSNNHQQGIKWMVDFLVTWLNPVEGEDSTNHENATGTDSGHGTNKHGDTRDVRMILPLCTKEQAKREGKIEDEHSAEWMWRSCFVRRLHGEYMIGEFWRNIESVYLGEPGSLEKGTEPPPDMTWTAWSAMTMWTRVLLQYLKEGTPPEGEEKRPMWDHSHVSEFLSQCPFLIYFDMEGQTNGNSTPRFTGKRQVSDFGDSKNKQSLVENEFKKIHQVSSQKSPTLRGKGSQQDSSTPEDKPPNTSDDEIPSPQDEGAQQEHDTEDEGSQQDRESK